MAPESSPMVTCSEAAERLGPGKISERTLRRAAANGEIPCLKIRNVYLLYADWLARAVTCPEQP